MAHTRTIDLTTDSPTWLVDLQKQSLTFIDNDTRTLTDVRLGAQGIDTNTNGTLYFDDFESRRFSYIGTLPDPGVDDPQATNQAGWFARTYQYSASIPHAVTSVNPETGSPDTYQYDANGNMTCRIENGVTYTHTFRQAQCGAYNAENRASSIAKRTGDCATGTILESWSFAYDGDGTRVMTAHFTGTQGTPDSTTSYYMGGAYEVKDSAVKKYYSIAGMMVATQDASGLQYLLTDHLGSVVAVTNASGTLTSQQRYLPFGGARSIPNSPIAGTDFTYTGQRMLDSGMGGIMDYKARFYSPYLNRFTQPDSIIPNPANPQTWNRFSYTINNPILYNDPDGHCGLLCAGVAIAVLALILTGDTPHQPTSAQIQSLADNSSTSAEALVNLFGTDQMPGSSDTPNSRFEAVMAATTSVPYLNFNVEFTDSGFKTDFQDPWGDASNNQVGHFLTAANMAYNSEPGSSEEKFFLTLIVGHEIVGDQKGFYAQWKAGNDNPEAIDLFLSGTDVNFQKILDIGRDPWEDRRGNSIEDLRLSYQGWNFGRLTRNNYFPSRVQQAGWLREHLAE
jgi:RHS repeat-associated protein